MENSDNSDSPLYFPLLYKKTKNNSIDINNEGSNAKIQKVSTLKNDFSFLIEITIQNIVISLEEWCKPSFIITLATKGQESTTRTHDPFPDPRRMISPLCHILGFRSNFFNKGDMVMYWDKGMPDIYYDFHVF